MKAQEEKKQVAEEPPILPAMEGHAYSDEFLNMMHDYAYEALRQHLLASCANPDASMLLEELIILHNIKMVYCREKLVAYYWNQSAGESIGQISQLVIKLGGHFVSAPLDMIKA